MKSERVEIEQIKAKYRFAVVFLLSLLVLVLAIVPVGAMYASQLDLLADTGLDGVTNRDLVDALWPVNSIYFSTSATNPGDAASGIFKGTAWVQWGNGRVPLGMGQDTDSGYETSNYTTVETRGGTETVTLTVDQMPSHRHGEYDHYANRGTRPITGASLDGAQVGANVSGGWSDTVGGSNASDRTAPHLLTGPTGGGNAHPNMQPYITCYMWKRIA